MTSQDMKLAILVSFFNKILKNVFFQGDLKNCFSLWFIKRDTKNCDSKNLSYLVYLLLEIQNKEKKVALSFIDFSSEVCFPVFN